MQNQRNIEASGGDEILYHITDGIAGAIGEQFFRSLVRHLAEALQVRYSFITECTDETRTRVRALAFWDGAGFAQDVEYSLRGTPCEKVIEGEVCAYPERLQLLFPVDKGLVTLGAESFAGLPLPNYQGKVLGHLVVMDTRHRVFDEAELRILRIFATRASAELERMRTDREVNLLNAELSTLLDINRAVGRHLHRDSLFGALAECLKTLVPRNGSVSNCLSMPINCRDISCRQFRRVARRHKPPYCRLPVPPATGCCATGSGSSPDAETSFASAFQ